MIPPKAAFVKVFPADSAWIPCQGLPNWRECDIIQAINAASEVLLMLLEFPNNIKELDEQDKWNCILQQLRSSWEEQKEDLNRFLCLSTAVWHCCINNDALAPGEIYSTELMNQLEALAEYGWAHFEGRWEFNMFFGYMIDLFPFFFGDWDTMTAKAKAMLALACEQAPDNPIPRVWYYGSFNGHPLYENAKKDAQTLAINSFPRAENQNSIHWYFLGMLLPYDADY